MVSDAIIEAIESGALREGDRLPSEEDFAAQHSVSVGTMQKALARLAQRWAHPARARARNLRLGAQGGSGRRAAPALSRRQGHPLTSYVHALGIKRLKRKGPWSDFLGGEAFVRVDRTINVGGKVRPLQRVLAEGGGFREARWRGAQGAGNQSARTPSAAPVPAYLACGPMDPLCAAHRRRGPLARSGPGQTGLPDGTARLHAQRQAAVLPERLRGTLLRAAADPSRSPHVDCLS